MVVSFWNHQFTRVLISLAVSERKKIDPQGALWSFVVTSTGQPCGAEPSTSASRESHQPPIRGDLDRGAARSPGKSSRGQEILMRLKRLRQASRSDE